MTEVPSTILAAVEKQLSTASVARGVETAAGYEIYIVANSGTPRELEAIDSEVKTVENALRESGSLRHPLIPVVSTW